MQTVKDTEITNEAFKKITIEKKHPKNSKSHTLIMKKEQIIDNPLISQS